MSAAHHEPRLPGLSRRALLMIGAAGAVAAGGALAPPAAATSAGTVLPLVAPLPPGAPDRALFAPHEQVFARYLMLVAPLANSVVDDDPERYGWMEDGWWRTPNDPMNSRIMEHVATLSWFLTHDRPWNPYYLDSNLQGRLDAALGYYLSLQGPRGAWPVTYEDESLATTGFGLVALSLTYRDLEEADLLAARRDELATAMRAGAEWLMNLDYWHWELPLQLHNQLAGALAGVGHAATVLDDASIAADLDDRIALLIEEGQAPAGYFHEPRGFDWGYNFQVAMPDLADIYLQTGNAALIEHVQRWAEFAQHVALPEPDAPGFVLLGSASMRNSTSVMTVEPGDDRDRAALGRVFVPQVPLLAALHSPAEDKAAARAAWAADPAPVATPAKGDTSPRLYAHVPDSPENLTAAERDAVLADWRPVRESTFTDYREGTVDQQLLFVRRPSYYLASVLGKRISTRVRTGPGLLWHPDAGAFIASFNNAPDDHWATVTAAGIDASLTDLSATFHDGPDATGAEIPTADLATRTSVFTGRYLNHGGAVVTDVTHLHDGVMRSVTAGGQAHELISLLLREEDVLELSDGTVASWQTPLSTTATWFAVVRGGTRLQISWGAPLEIELTPTGRRYLGALREQHALRVHHTGTLTTSVTVVDVAQVNDRVPFSVTAHTTRQDREWVTWVHAVNLDTRPIDLRLVTTAGHARIDDLTPGQDAVRSFSSWLRVPAPGRAIATATSGLPRVATQSFAM